MKLLHDVEAFLLRVSFDFSCDLTFSKLSFSSLLRATGMKFRKDYELHSEKVIDYMELVSEFEQQKLFILYNFRSIISDWEAEIFLETALHHGYDTFIIECCEHEMLNSDIL